MNYQYLIPGAQGDPASFDANSTLTLGSFSKRLDARTQISVDYSAVLPPVMIDTYSFKVRPGGSPQLWVDESELGTGANFITFFISGGIAGRAYTITINVNLATGETRSDTLDVQVLGEECGCAFVTLPPLNQGVVSGDGSIVVNTAPRFFVSATPPVGANVLDRWYNTTTGNVFDYISNGLSSLWTPAGSGGGGGGGGGTGSNVTILSISPIHPDGVTTIFTLTSTVGQPVNIGTTNTLFVSVDGVWQDAMTQYVATGNQISFVQPPSGDSQVFMLWFAPYNPGI